MIRCHPDVPSDHHSSCSRLASFAEYTDCTHPRYSLGCLLGNSYPDCTGRIGRNYYSYSYRSFDYRSLDYRSLGRSHSNFVNRRPLQYS